MTAAATSADPLYMGVNAADVTISSVDNDTVGHHRDPVVRVDRDRGGRGRQHRQLHRGPELAADGRRQHRPVQQRHHRGNGEPRLADLHHRELGDPPDGDGDRRQRSIDDGNLGFSIVTAAAVSSDGAYNVLNAADVTVTNLDNDTAGVTVTAAMGLAVTEAAGAGNQATFTIVMTAQPTANTSISLTSSDTTEAIVTPAAVVFTSVNWNIPQTVTVIGLDDDLDDGDVAFTVVTGAGFSADPAYSGLAVDDVAVSNTDNDAAGILVTAAPGISVNEAAGPGHATTFTVVLTSRAHRQRGDRPVQRRHRRGDGRPGVADLHHRQLGQRPGR